MANIVAKAKPKQTTSLHSIEEYIDMSLRYAPQKKQFAVPTISSRNVCVTGETEELQDMVSIDAMVVSGGGREREGERLRRFGV